MIANGLDLNYVGVCDIWNNDLGVYYFCSGRGLPPPPST